MPDTRWEPLLQYASAMDQTTRTHLQAELHRLEIQGRSLETVALLLHEKDDPFALALHAERVHRHAAEWAAFREVRIAFERLYGPLEVSPAGLNRHVATPVPPQSDAA